MFQHEAFGSTAMTQVVIDQCLRDERCQLMQIGNSVLEEPLWLVRVGNGPRTVHINACVHANEWLTSRLLWDGLTYLLELAHIDLFKRCTIDVVPMVNPDGANLCLDGRTDWKANANGVDLNDQFPAGWLVEKNRRQIYQPSSQDFAGDLPLSEPEAQALVRLVRQSDYQSVMSVHSQGEEIYWNYRGYEPVQSAEWASHLATVSGYASVALSNSDAGFKDWFIQEYARPGFTVEVGMGRNPLPLSDFPDICQRFRVLLKKFILLNCES